MRSSRCCRRPTTQVTVHKGFLMSNPFIAARELLRCAASRKDRVFILSKGKALLARSIAHTSLISMQEGRWRDCVDTEWDSSAIAVARRPSSKVVVVGEDGDVAIYLGDLKHTREQISPGPTAIRNAGVVSGYVYACGMKRQVFKRVDESRWVDLSAQRPAGNEAVGFEDIDGYSESEVYAVGWKGEIWKHDGATWQAFPLSTNLILTSVCCAPNGKVYVAGQQGLLASGRNTTWQIVDHQDPFDLDIWDLCWYRDELYVATMRALFKLTNDRLVRVDFGASHPVSCYSLSTAEDVLWSVGRDDLASFDGISWTVYT
jgi:hypothetical protein